MWLQGFAESDRWFDVAVKVAKEFIKSHIISSDNDRIGVVFYGAVSCIECVCNASWFLGMQLIH